MTATNSSNSKWEHKMTCPVCDEEFIAKRRDHKYCDARCSQVAYYKRKHKYKDQFDDRSDLEKIKLLYKDLFVENGRLREEINKALEAKGNMYYNANMIQDEKIIVEKKVEELEAVIADLRSCPIIEE